jgi:hypothetical protein
MKGTPTIILRFYGREVARVYFDKKKNEKFFKISPVGKVTLKNAGEEKELRHLNQKFKKTFDNNDLEIGKEYKWNSREGENFRSIFANKNSKNELTLVNEHYLESQLLKDLSSKVRKSKSIPHIQPIKYAGCRLQFPTKLKASKAKNDIVTYARNGGGIDVLARRKIGAKGILCAVELKDESKSDEIPENAIKQAIAYATFIDYILRKSDTETSKKWFKIFGLEHQKYNEKPMKIFAVIVMPINDNYSNKDKSKGISFAKPKQNISTFYKIGFKNKNDSEEMHDNLELHYLYFRKEQLEAGHLKEIQTSL